MEVAVVVAIDIVVAVLALHVAVVANADVTADAGTAVFKAVVFPNRAVVAST